MINIVKVRNDLTGMKFNHLTVLYQTDDYVTPQGFHEAQWHCVCDCEEHNEIDVVGKCLKNGHTKSCGCYKKKRISETHKKYNQYDLSNGYGIGYTSNTNKPFYFDLEDYDLIKDICWYEDKDGYAVSKTYNLIKMHRLLTNCPNNKVVDHINHNGLDNRKMNLRICTIQQNSQNLSLKINNKSGIIGVRQNIKYNIWTANITVNQKMIYLGTFKNKDDAIVARLKAEKEYFKEFAPQKHLFNKYNI